MGNILYRHAYAKVNLHLAVGTPYTDGYHPIESIFSLVGLADHLEMTWSKSDVFSFSVTGLEAYCDEGGDTLTKAANLWHEKSQLNLSVQVHCEKHIPVKAGLGGGSSDAAALLLLLQQVAKEKALSFVELKKVALQVGSDVPFFLSGFSCALVEGRGEKISELTLGPKHILLAQPRGYSVSTKEAYARIDGLLATNDLKQSFPLQTVLASLKKKTPDWRGVFSNDFEKCTDYPAFYETVNSLAQKYAGFGCLSGSGSCWYFISEDEKSVLELHGELHKRFMDSVQLWCTKLI
ncbi:MAG TPA: 4-(cytidine 5'-diphospho)-2-C-methyl-D-erythritol kinase [Sphaerochaeta sp.]|nr:4-(cytidine 5'-diphospho)-2-C-methyl-D-erythritol kinase [Sphaerochaeta sp.]